MGCRIPAPALRAATILCFGASAFLWGCGRPDTVSLAVESPAAIAPAAVSAQPSGDVMDKWSRNCALCHVSGNAGAPRLGNTEEWAPRVAKGMDVLLQHTLEGFNDMPPLGYCMSCERDDFVAMIELMAADAR